MHPQPDPAILARRLRGLAAGLWTVIADGDIDEPALINLESLLSDLSTLAEQMTVAAIPCDVPECTDRHRCDAAQPPASPINTPCLLSIGHADNHDNGFSEWTDPQTCSTDSTVYMVVAGDGTRFRVSGIDSARIVANTVSGYVNPL